MVDTDVSHDQNYPNSLRWLLLITAVPSDPAYLRVKLRRRIQRLGAVGLKGAVYLLPGSATTREGFDGLRREIVADGGDATLCSAQLIEGMTDAAVIAGFTRDRSDEYRKFVAVCGDFEKAWGIAAPARRPVLISERGRLERRLAGILGRDYFDAPAREAALQAIERIAVLDIAVANAD
ncbi:MAG: Chromate resistance protein ChrB [Gemmatimonadales bacterium]